MAHDVFISYSHRDKPTADAICAKLEAGGLRCWYAPRDIEPGTDWAAAIIDAIESSRAFVLVFTSHSNVSQQVMREVSKAVQQGIPIIPFKLTKEEPSKGMEYYLTTVHWLDAMDGPLYSNIQVLDERVRGVLGEHKGNPPAASVQTGSNKKWINYVVAGIIVVLVGVILWLTGVFGGGTPGVTATPEPTITPTEVPTEAPTEAPAEVPAEVLTKEPTEAPTQEPADMETAKGAITTTTATGDDYPELRQMDESEKKKIRRLVIAGDKIITDFIYEQYNTEIDDQGNYCLYDEKTNEPIETSQGTLTDLSILDGMSSLEVLWLYDQPLTTLKGIEQLPMLSQIWLVNCKNMEEISPAFGMESLNSIHLQRNHIKTIDGISKLKNLIELIIDEEYLDDLSPLFALDTSFAAEAAGGFDLCLVCPQVKDYSFLKSFPKLKRFAVQTKDPIRCFSELDQSEVPKIDTWGCFNADPDQFTPFVEILKKDHPEVTELVIGGNDRIPDLSGLTEMTNLKVVCVSSDMEDAIKSLEGVRYTFRLEIK